MSRQLPLIRFSLVVLAAGALFLLLANYAYSFTGRQKAPAMQASVTYLYLLRKTPFFTRLTTAQLRDVIAAANHITQNADDTAGMLGAYLLGQQLPPMLFGLEPVSLND